MTIAPRNQSHLIASAIRFGLETLEPRRLFSVVLESAVATPLSATPAGNPVTPVIADVNGDGLLDVVVGFESSSAVTEGMVQVGLGDGAGTFTFGTPIDAGVFVGKPIVADFDGDAKPDLAVANAFGGQVNVLKGNGDGTFAAPVTFAAGISPEALATADFNGDGRADLAIANRSSNSVQIYAGDPTTLLGASPISVATGVDPASIATGDFNQDSITDLLVGCSGGDQAVTGVLQVFAGVGDGTFSATPVQTSGPRGFTAVADFDSNGAPDLAFGITDKDKPDVALNQGDGTFALTKGSTGLTGSSAASVAVAVDLNEDTKPDLLTAVNGTITVLPGNGDGTFGKKVEFDSAGGTAAAVADVNGDGRADVLTIAAAKDVQTGRTLNISIGRRVGPDMTIQWKVPPPSSVLNAANLKISVTVKNTGNEKFKGEAPIQIIFSTDSTIDLTNASLNDSIVIQAFPKLSLGIGKSKSVTLKPSLTVGSGTYFAIAVVDPSGSTGDLNRFDNTDTAASQVTVADPFIDFTATIPTLKPTTAKLGKSVTATVLLVNQGNIPAKGKVEFKLLASLDTVSDETDPVVMDTLKSVNLKAGASKKISLKFKIAGDVTPGTYFVLGAVTADSSLFEIDIDNNSAVSDQTLVVV